MTLDVPCDVKRNLSNIEKCHISKILLSLKYTILIDFFLVYFQKCIGTHTLNVVVNEYLLCVTDIYTFLVYHQLVTTSFSINHSFLCDGVVKYTVSNRNGNFNLKNLIHKSE